ncbi:uncharacterized protein Bfra_010678 [Botrytis fragariae]|uniref:Uncharacterized protein n=1 Tax=Botrytis fragariae TaxID=1964551 RepID=A0A8H6AI21_9HELO|nr:uncharacterized protein Bfra_010678 [Botrytis fragariae]KAF5867709.1 hypothetical protein Bfra_010678 [Botrytis fragariae]
MPWFSILPESLAFVEVWARNTFFVLGILCIGPWLLTLLFDIIFYLFRLIHHEMPYFGGRARDRPRPRAPSLSERPNGQGRPRILTMPSVNGTVNIAGILEETAEGIKKGIEEAAQPRKDSGAIVDD